jgi:hypothetical protein
MAQRSLERGRSENAFNPIFGGWTQLTLFVYE